MENKKFLNFENTQKNARTFMTSTLQCCDNISTRAAIIRYASLLRNTEHQQKIQSTQQPFKKCNKTSGECGVVNSNFATISSSNKQPLSVKQQWKILCIVVEFGSPLDTRNGMQPKRQPLVVHRRRKAKDGRFNRTE